jgi:hypothetical protein
LTPRADDSDHWQPLWGERPAEVVARILAGIQTSEPYYADVLRLHDGIVATVLYAAAYWPPSFPLLVEASQLTRFDRVLALAAKHKDTHPELWRGVQLRSRFVSSAEGHRALAGGLRASISTAPIARAFFGGRRTSSLLVKRCDTVCRVAAAGAGEAGCRGRRAGAKLVGQTVDEGVPRSDGLEHAQAFGVVLDPELVIVLHVCGHGGAVACSVAGDAVGQLAYLGDLVSSEYEGCVAGSVAYLLAQQLLALAVAGYGHVLAEGLDELGDVCAEACGELGDARIAVFQDVVQQAGGDHDVRAASVA